MEASTAPHIPLLTGRLRQCGSQLSGKCGGHPRPLRRSSSHALKPGSKVLWVNLFPLIFVCFFSPSLSFSPLVFLRPSLKSRLQTQRKWFLGIRAHPNAGARSRAWEATRQTVARVSLIAESINYWTWQNRSIDQSFQWGDPFPNSQHIETVTYDNIHHEHNSRLIPTCN